MAKRLLGVLLCLLLLPSCSYIPTGYTEELLSAPTVNDQQAKVRAALEATLNLSNIQYRYIQTGDYRSPFVFFELDGSGRRGAVVFYAYKGDPSNTAARAKVLRENDDGEWAQVFDISELGLVEMTRKRVSEGLIESMSTTCEVCEGRGIVFDDPEL